MSQFEIMNDTVNKLCNSLITKSHEWVFDICYFHNKNNPKIKYWHSVDNKPITEIWNGISTAEVFSCSQGEKILEAYNKARVNQASLAQQTVINSFK